MKATLLGTSAAWPIPRPGCRCVQCEEARAEPSLRRTRPTLRLEMNGEVTLLDVSPDILFQFEREGLSPRVDRVLVSHTHADHILGLDDLVWMQSERSEPLPVHAAPRHRDRITALFPHLLKEGQEKIRFGDWSPGTKIRLPGCVLEGFETGHRATSSTTGLLVHFEAGGRELRVAYATDMGDLPSVARAALEGVDLFVGDGTYIGEAGYGHPGTDAVGELARSLGARQISITHVGHVEMTNDEICQRLGTGARLLYDGDDLIDV
ncbi:MAG: MBL fold metallo-hydrolase [Planctomycetota bacterium]|jgi:phosphoribosyl 1,2-cyclic phosphate phosphodiesterase